MEQISRSCFHHQNLPAWKPLRWTTWILIHLVWVQYRNCSGGLQAKHDPAWTFWLKTGLELPQVFQFQGISRVLDADFLLIHIIWIFEGVIFHFLVHLVIGLGPPGLRVWGMVAGDPLLRGTSKQLQFNVHKSYNWVVPKSMEMDVSHYLGLFLSNQPTCGSPSAWLYSLSKNWCAVYALVNFNAGGHPASDSSSSSAFGELGVTMGIWVTSPRYPPTASSPILPNRKETVAVGSHCKSPCFRPKFGVALVQNPAARCLGGLLC